MIYRRQVSKQVATLAAGFGQNSLKISCNEDLGSSFN